MDPVQRIPRYTLLFRTMIKHMAPGDPQRKKLVQADGGKGSRARISLLAMRRTSKRNKQLYGTV